MVKIVLQSVLIPKKWGITKSKEYIKKKEYIWAWRGKEPYISGDYLRVRQRDPIKEKRYFIRKNRDNVILIFYYKLLKKA